MLQAFSVNSTPLGQTNSLPRASSKASVWSAKLKMSVVLCCNVAFHLPAVCSLSVTKSCSMRKHHIYWADNPSVLKGLSSCHNRAALLLFHQFRFTNVCCRNNPGGGEGQHTQKKDVEKKSYVLWAVNQKFLFGVWKWWKENSCNTCVILRAIECFIQQALQFFVNSQMFLIVTRFTYRNEHMWSHMWSMLCQKTFFFVHSCWQK